MKSLNLQAGLLLALMCVIPAGHCAESYSYDARGRLISVTYTSGATIYYTYDAAGNRASSGPTAPGTFTYVSSSHTALGSSLDVASLVVQNTGAGPITGITWTCAGAGGFHTFGTVTTSIAVGAQATFQCRSEAGGSYMVTVTLNSALATNAPFSKYF